MIASANNRWSGFRERGYGGEVPNRLAITVISPEESPWHLLELRFLIDGQDVISEVFDSGPGEDPDRLLKPDSPLLARHGPVTVLLAEAECTWGCCGRIDVGVRREADQIIWDRWFNPAASHVPLGEFRFDAEQYENEILRAHQERTWEWQGRTIARLVETSLRAEPTVMGQWHSSLDFAVSLPGRRSEVEVVFASPSRQPLLDRPMEHTQYRLRIPLTEEPAEVQADRILASLKTNDPRDSAERCGGYRAPVSDS